MTEGRDLAWLLHPISYEEFATRHLDREPLHVSGRAPDHYAALFGWADLERAAADALAADSSKVHLVKDGRYARFEQFGPVEAHQLRRRFLEGWTVNVLDVHAVSPALRGLVRELELVFRRRISANLYLSPGGGAQGFAPHADDHDTLVLQLDGDKLWTVHGSEAGEPEREVALSSGDFLYVPAGRVHEARSEERASLHVTLGVRPYRVAQMVQDLAARLVRELPELRRVVPLPGLPFDEDELDAALRAALAACAERARSAELVEERLRQLVAELPTVAADLFEREPLELEADTVLRKRDGMLALVVLDGDKVAIRYPGATVRGPLAAEAAMRFVAAVERPFRVDELPELDLEGQKALAWKLVHEGLLTLRAPGR